MQFSYYLFWVLFWDRPWIRVISNQNAIVKKVGGKEDIIHMKRLAPFPPQGEPQHEEEEETDTSINKFLCQCNQFL